MIAATHYLRQGARCILLSMIIFSGSCDDDEHSSTQIIDDNLESGNIWTFHNVTPAAHEGLLDNTVSSSSSHSLEIKSTLAESEGFSFWRRTWVPDNIPVGSHLELKVKVKLTEVTGNGVYIAFRGDQGTSNVFFKSSQGQQDITGSRDFETYTVSLDSYPEGVETMFIFLILDGNSTGTANFDDISLISHH